MTAARTVGAATVCKPPKKFKIVAMVTYLFISNQFEFVGQVAEATFLFLRLDLLAQMVSSYEETCPATCYRNQSLGHVSSCFPANFICVISIIATILNFFGGFKLLVTKT